MNKKGASTVSFLVLKKEGRAKENMTPDLINGLFEILGSVMLWLNVGSLYRDKQVMGVNGWTVGFFTSWGFWNLFYYPNLDQWFSFAGGLSITIANTVWLGLMLYYKYRSKND